MPPCDTSGRRLGHAVLVLLGVSILSFLFAELAPGDPLDEMRLDPRISAATSRPCATATDWTSRLPQKYVRWLQSVARGELGYLRHAQQPGGAAALAARAQYVAPHRDGDGARLADRRPVGAWAAAGRGDGPIARGAARPPRC